MAPHARAVLAILAVVAPSIGFAESTSGAPAPYEAFYSCMSLRKEKGVAACRAALQLTLGKERRAVAQQVLAWHLANLARWDEAVDAYRELVRLRPDNAEAHLRLGEALLFGVGKAGEALPALEDAARIDARNARVFGSQGFALAALDRFRESVAAFEHAERLDPGFWIGRPSARAVYEAARRGERWPQAEKAE
jgi:tetratricopeptide (TPR) repeat protein